MDKPLPNLIIIMLDQLSGALFDDQGLPAPFLHMPNIRKLAEGGLRFSKAYTGSPLCTPARGVFMTGQLPSATGIYDNAAYFPSNLPTYAHYLRLAGYQTSLVGKMHFIGADQLHGFEERLTTDIYPADFGWTPDYREPHKRIDWWYHNMDSVLEAGIATTTNQLEFDDEVAHFAKAKLYDLARGRDPRPFSITISFTHPHDPYRCRKSYWDLYEGCDALMPTIGRLQDKAYDPHSKRILESLTAFDHIPNDEQIAAARRAYFGNISMIDAHIGEILDILEQTGQQATILFTADHGDMLGERGLWFKMSFFEGSARIPIVIHGAGIEAGVCHHPVSQLDILPTLLDMIGQESEATNYKGHSLLQDQQKRPHPVMMEYMAEASCTPMVAVVDERYKYTYCLADPPQLFDLANDPHELKNLANDPNFAKICERFEQYIKDYWDLNALHQQIMQDQQRRHLVHQALTIGKTTSWEYQPFSDAGQRFMRNHMDLNVVEQNQFAPNKGQ